jgi:hypothetical protein
VVSPSSIVLFILEPILLDRLMHNHPETVVVRVGRAGRNGRKKVPLVWPFRRDAEFRNVPIAPLRVCVDEIP